MKKLLSVLLTLVMVLALPVTAFAEVETNYTGVAQAADGDWYYYKNGEVQKDYTGLQENKYGWWRIENGKVNFNATGIYENQYGWWRVENGKVNFNAYGVYENEYGYWRVEKGKVNFKANGIYENEYGWWKTTNGKVTFKENGVFQNQYGWWKVENSKVNFNFTGIASNVYGSWYLQKGKVNFNYSGTVKYNGKNFTVKKGKVQQKNLGVKYITKEEFLSWFGTPVSVTTKNWNTYFKEVNVEEDYEDGYAKYLKLQLDGCIIEQERVDLTCNISYTEKEYSHEYATGEKAFTVSQMIDAANKNPDYSSTKNETRKLEFLDAIYDPSPSFTLLYSVMLDKNENSFGVELQNLNSYSITKAQGKVRPFRIDTTLLEKNKDGDYVLYVLDGNDLYGINLDNHQTTRTRNGGKTIPDNYDDYNWVYLDILYDDFTGEIDIDKEIEMPD